MVTFVFVHGIHPELSALARQSADSFVEARKKLFDVAGRQMNASVQAAGKTLELVKPFPFVRLAELTRNGVKGFVDAPKSLMDLMLKERTAQQHKAVPVHRAKRASHPSKKASMAAAA
jgi:hypothetical protein